MKRILLAATAAAVCLLLTACGRLLPTEYAQVSVHSESGAEQTETDALTAENYAELRRDIRSFVQNGVEHGVIRIRSYTGEVEEDLSRATYEVAREDPLGAYAIDYMTHDCSLIVSYYEIHIDITFRKTPEQISAVEYVSGDTGARTRIEKAMDQYADELAIYTGFYNNQDYAAMAQAYYDANPGKLMLMPRVHVATYPESGSARIVELSFEYDLDADALKSMQQAVADSLRAASVYVRYRDTEMEKAELLFTYLTERFQYTQGQSETPVYSLFCEGVASSESMAKSWQLLCDQVGIECVTVTGNRGADAYWWNIVCLDGQYFHVDVMDDLLTGNHLRLYGDAEMADYFWDTEAYPVCVGLPLPAVAEEQPPEQIPEEPATETPEEPEPPQVEVPAES